MKVIIKGEPKEIAAYEMALKKDEQKETTVYGLILKDNEVDVDKIAEKILSKLKATRKTSSD